MRRRSPEAFLHLYRYCRTPKSPDTAGPRASSRAGKCTRWWHEEARGMHIILIEGCRWMIVSTNFSRCGQTVRVDFCTSLRICIHACIWPVRSLTQHEAKRSERAPALSDDYAALQRCSAQTGRTKAIPDRSCAPIPNHPALDSEHVHVRAHGNSCSFCSYCHKALGVVDLTNTSTACTCNKNTMTVTRPTPERLSLQPPGGVPSLIQSPQHASHDVDRGRGTKSASCAQSETLISCLTHLSLCSPACGGDAHFPAVPPPRASSKLGSREEQRRVYLGPKLSDRATGGPDAGPLIERFSCLFKDRACFAVSAKTRRRWLMGRVQLQAQSEGYCLAVSGDSSAPRRFAGFCRRLMDSGVAENFLMEKESLEVSRVSQHRRESDISSSATPSGTASSHPTCRTATRCGAAAGSTWPCRASTTSERLSSCGLDIEPALTAAGSPQRRRSCRSR